MTPERWQRVEQLLHSALKLEESHRADFVKQASGEDEALRQEVERLLAHEQTAKSFLEVPALEIVAKEMAEEPDRVLIGRQIGAYKITSLLGTGGMGEVYKARDSKLNRSVAIKVLPPDKTSDADRKRRFVHEARAASALNHPNIITIHDIGREDGIDFIVMEYVDGKTLDKLIPRRGLKLSEVLKYSIPIADALAKAHSAGIIHRDLKPGNVMVTEDGMVKVLDFGLAKLTERQKATEENSSATGTGEVTEPGTVMGTMSYMSPEQAEGKGVDARSDIFSFGSLLYEMVTGQSAFHGDSTASTLAAILNREPKPISKLVPGIPSDLEKTIGRCLRKDRERRFQHMDDLKVALQELKEESDSGALPGTDPARSASRSSAVHLQAVPLARRTWVWLGVAFVVLAMAIGVWLFRGSPGNPQPLPELIPLTTYAGSERSPSFSPDGNQVAFSWNGEKQDNYDIYVKLIGSPKPLQLTKDPADDLSPAFSPDRQSIGFVRVVKERATFIVIPSIGGPERVVAEIPPPHVYYTDGPLFAWFPDGKWVVINGLALLSIESGELRNLTSPPGKLFKDASPAVSPDGSIIAFSRWLGWFRWGINLLFLTENREPKGEPQHLRFLRTLLTTSATWAPNGQEIIFTSQRSLWRMAASGGGKPEQLPFSQGQASWPTISHNGNRLAYQRNLWDSNIWRVPLSSSGTATGPPARFIASTRMDATPQYSPEGTRIAFESGRTGILGIWVSDADGSNAVELAPSAGNVSGSPSWSPDGQRIAFDSDLEGNMNIYVVRSSGGRPVRLTTDPAEHNVPRWSRDGNWIYFASSRTGRYEVWKAPSEGGEAVQVTRNGGFAALESLDGKTVYYTKGTPEVSMALWKVSVNGGDDSQVLPSVRWRSFDLVDKGIYFNPDPGSDGKYAIQFLSFATGKVKMVAPIPSPPFRALTVSPDRRYLLYGQIDEESSDLMLVENFR